MGKPGIPAPHCIMLLLLMKLPYVQHCEEYSYRFQTEALVFELISLEKKCKAI